VDFSRISHISRTELSLCKSPPVPGRGSAQLTPALRPALIKWNGEEEVLLSAPLSTIVILNVGIETLSD
jgi:hypothetical protein